MKLSLSMIVKNEAKNLARCLESVRGLVDEIVVVDTGSTDDTVKIAESYGAKIGHFEWCDDFAAARNASLALCTGDWVLVLDADEAIDKMDHDVIRNVLDESDYPVYNLILRNYFSRSSFSTFDKAAVHNDTEYQEGKEFPYYSDATVMRLFRRSPEIRWEGKVHELFCRFFTARGIQIGHINAVVHHYGKMDEERENAKKKYYLELAEQDLATRPNDTQTLFNVAIQAYVAGDTARCLYACGKYMELDKRVKPILLLMSGVCCQTFNRHEKALECFGLILNRNPDHVIVMVQAAISKAALGDVDSAKGILELAIKAGPEYANTYLVLAKIHEGLGDREGALQVIRCGLNVVANDPELLAAERKYQVRTSLVLGGLRGKY